MFCDLGIDFPYIYIVLVVICSVTVTLLTVVGILLLVVLIYRRRLQGSKKYFALDLQPLYIHLVNQTVNSSCNPPLHEQSRIPTHVQPLPTLPIPPAIPLPAPPTLLIPSADTKYEEIPEHMQARITYYSGLGLQGSNIEEDYLSM